MIFYSHEAKFYFCLNYNKIGELIKKNFKESDRYREFKKIISVSEKEKKNKYLKKILNLNLISFHFEIYIKKKNYENRWKLI